MTKLQRQIMLKKGKRRTFLDLYFNSGVGEIRSQKYSNKGNNNSENKKAPVAVLGWCKLIKLVKG